MNKDKWISLAIGILAVLGLGLILWFVFFSDTVVGAEATRIDQCDEVFTYTQEVNDHRVFIDAINTQSQGNPDSITVAGKSGYEVQSVKMEVEDNNTNGWDVALGAGNITSYNPSGTDIESIEVKVKKVCPKPSPTPEEPEVTPVPVEVNPLPEGMKSTTETPRCDDGSTSKLVANMHVVRNGSSADVRYFITEGTTSDILYKVNGQDGWQYSVIDVKGNSDNFVNYTINSLVPSFGYTFGVLQRSQCGTGAIATAVVVDPPANGKLFKFSYWIW